MNIKRLGILTGGGDCPGLNPVIRAVTRRAIQAGISVVGIRNGWKGLITAEIIPLDLQSVSGILPKGGTILGTSRTNPYKHPEDLARVKENLVKLQLDVLIAIGGEDTLGVATKLSKEGVNIIGVPKTIDNDLSATDFTFGFDTAVNIAMEAIDRLHTTAESHHRIMVAEVMGRHAGWIATYAGIAGGADVILIPEEPIDIDAVCDIIKKRHSRGKDFSIVVVAEGATFKEGSNISTEEKLDEFGHVRLGGIGQILSGLIEQRTGFETRVTVLGHIQRGGSPTAFDRVLGTRFGVKAIELVLEGRFGQMVSLQGNKIAAVPIEQGTGTLKTVDPQLYQLAKTFFG
ncbi:MAG: 6-phosphofructokinase [Candidatus Omnitrophica bacterium]|nr:6-phosphofructokinase [Candidatus Omnitrophota bacterium]MBI2173833.1 6-phosphofructokinase [Candidatus Omnitrophota bacterium]MBI3009406.1 6-phosphofructokinase [Candidatus Omnitrophota bacterium]